VYVYMCVYIYIYICVCVYARTCVETCTLLTGVKNKQLNQQNKSDVDHDRLERLREREDLGPSPNNNRITPSPTSASGQDAYYKMEDGEDTGTQQSPAKSVEMTSVLNGLQGSDTCSS